MQLHARPFKRTMADGTTSGAGVSIIEELPGVVVVKVPFNGGGWMAHDVVATGEFSEDEVREAWGESFDPQLLKSLWDAGALHQMEPTKQSAIDALAASLSEMPEEPVLADLVG